MGAESPGTGWCLRVCVFVRRERSGHCGCICPATSLTPYLCVCTLCAKIQSIATPAVERRSAATLEGRGRAERAGNTPQLKAQLVNTRRASILLQFRYCSGRRRPRLPAGRLPVWVLGPMLCRVEWLAGLDCVCLSGSCLSAIILTGSWCQNVNCRMKRTFKVSLEVDTKWCIHESDT